MVIDESYDNVELRFYDTRLFNFRKRLFEDVLYINRIFRPVYPGRTLRGHCHICRYSLLNPSVLDTIYFYSNETNKFILADKVGAQLWEVHEQYKRRIL